MIIRPKHKGPGTFVPRATLKATDATPTLSGISPNSGRIAGGGSVTITGHNFSSVNGVLPTVMFGSTPATAVVVVDANTITCTVPASAETGVVDVVVTVGRFTLTLVASYTYFTTAVISLSPPYGPFGGGTNVTIFGYNFLAGSTVTFGGNAATNVIFIDSQHIRCTTPAHAVGNVDVVVTEPLAASSSTLRNGFQYTLLTRGDDIRRMPGIVIRDVLNNTPNTCSFTIDGQSNTPTIGEKIEITDQLDADRLLFAGTAQSIIQDYEDQTDQIVWRVTAVDFTWLLNRRRPFGEYVNMSVSDIVRDMISRYAPGFTAVHVQSNLAKVTVFFDGSQDFVTCLSTLAAAIGGGHWFVDYVMDVHFFHIPPKNVPAFGPGSIFGELPSGGFGVSGTPMTVAEDAAASTDYTYEPEYLMFRHTNVYDDGTESAYFPCSNVLYWSARKRLSFTIPVGAAAGTLTVVKRRVYVNRFNRNGAFPFESVLKFCEIPDNVTTAFTTGFVGSLTPSVATITDTGTRGGTLGAPAPLFLGHPVGPTAGPGVSINTLLQTGLLMGGSFEFKTAFLYRDGSVSFPGPASNTANKPIVKGEGVASFNLAGIHVGPTVNGVDCIARVVYFCQGSSANPGYSTHDLLPEGFQWPVPFLPPAWDESHTSEQFLIIPDNTTTTAIMNLMQNDGGLYPVGLNRPYGGGTSEDGGGAPNTDPIPVWPNPDGPYLEDTDPPNDLDDDNDEILMDPPFTSSIDISQIRNRIFVVGSGSTVAEPAAAGSTTVSVADPYAFSPSGGTLRIGTEIIPYSGTTGVNGEGTVLLNRPTQKDWAAGESIVNYLQADHVESQRLMGKVELDKDGNPTDGVHEYTIVDTSLKARFQLWMRANAELELFALPIVKINYATRDPKTKSGQTVHVDLTHPPCVGDFLIQDVTIDQIHDESDQLMPRYTASACSVRYELNDLLLSILGGGMASSSGGTANIPQVTSLSGVVATAVKQAVQLASPAGAASEVPSVSGGPVQVFGITFVLDAVRMRTLFSDPLVIREGVSGYAIRPVAVTFEQRTGASTFNTGFNVFLVHEGLAVGVALTNQIAVSNATNRYIWNQSVPANVTDGVDVEADGLALTLKSSVDVTGGSGTFRITVIYYIHATLPS